MKKSDLLLLLNERGRQPGGLTLLHERGSMSGARGVRSSSEPGPSTFDLRSAALSIRAADILGSLVALAIPNRIAA